MLIRTHNRLVNLSCIDSIVITKISEDKKERVITAYNGYASINLGVYGNEERAIEILDEICNAYIGLNCIDRKTGIALVKNGVFQMPDD